MNFTIKSKSIEQTLEIGQIIGRFLKGGDVLELVSDLGGGKTTLVKGIAAGAGSKDVVQSPSFTISRVYACRDKLDIHHFDFYRLSDPGVLAGELADSLDDKNTIVIVEWADIVNDILPESRTRINIKSVDESEREFEILISKEGELLRSKLNKFEEKYDS